MARAGTDRGARVAVTHSSDILRAVCAGMQNIPNPNDTQNKQTNIKIRNKARFPKFIGR